MRRTTMLSLSAAMAMFCNSIVIPQNAEAGDPCRSQPAARHRGHDHQQSQYQNASYAADAGSRSVDHRGSESESAGVTSETPKSDVVDTAVKAGSFKTLVAAVQAAGLAETLKGKGPFTVFAPTDEAFGKLPEGTVESLLKPENRKKLQAILTYHVVPGRVMAKDVVKLSTAKTVNGQSVQIQVEDGSVRIDDAKLVKTDIACSNGVIHVIDSILLPKEND